MSGYTIALIIIVFLLVGIIWAQSAQIQQIPFLKARVKALEASLEKKGWSV